jgi:proline iminopeptidase
MEPRDGFITTESGLRLFFQTVGSGPKKILFPNGIYLVDDFSRIANGRTLIFYDVRNRGRSDAIADQSQLVRGIHQDVDDLDAVRRHFRIDRADLIGHSYMGLMVILYAMKHGPSVGRIVQIGPMQPKHLPDPAADSTLRECFGKIGELQKERGSLDPVAFCRKFWSILRVIYVTNPADADKISWDRCDLPNERNFMTYWMGSLMPSIQQLELSADALAAVTSPVLTVHGTRDRSAPYSGGRDWALTLPNARLVAVEDGGHAPWIENPDLVFGSINAFLDGAWPDVSERVIETDDGRQPAAKS